jgi:drug/metabolite transporter (DMT)-like permease
LATFFYGINVNLIGKYMSGLGSLNIASVAFSFLVIPSAIILAATGYFTSSWSSPNFLTATGASVVLGVFGTAIASVLFYVLVKRAGAVFASTVTYGIPFVAVFWGLLSGERITLPQIVCLGVILLGVYIANRQT